ncbi:pro-neuregulin-4, membrane-bound isoform-like [Brienomyrus brachyistius]|uniref:pro-neuregulin-4, membrane-bound isoform-like n=1 Tax=Brienomyrus brachyistius TaxID=42636 RepID=UPI0020B35792|nr:pro-neuregulin-4, membrane-bound isoform-like [Brienomyrus brachyistius]
MMADKNIQEHGKLCNASEASYCTNGGTCYRIPTMPTITCICGDGYKGSRCEEFQLFSTSETSDNVGLIAAVVVLVILIIMALTVVIYLIFKLWAQKKEAEKQQRNRPYRQVPRRV